MGKKKIDTKMVNDLAKEIFHKEYKDLGEIEQMFCRFQEREYFKSGGYRDQVAKMVRDTRSTILGKKNLKSWEYTIIKKLFMKRVSPTEIKRAINKVLPWARANMRTINSINYFMKQITTEHSAIVIERMDETGYRYFENETLWFYLCYEAIIKGKLRNAKREYRFDPWYGLEFVSEYEKSIYEDMNVLKVK